MLLLIKYRPIVMVGLWCYNQPGVTELLIMRDPHFDWMCFKSVKTLGDLHFVEKASAFSIAKNVDLRLLYPIRVYIYTTQNVIRHTLLRRLYLYTAHMVI